MTTTPPQHHHDPSASISSAPASPNDSLSRGDPRSPPRMNTDDIAAAVAAGSSSPPSVADYDDTAAASQSPTKFQEFVLLHTSEIELSKRWLLDAFDDPRYASSSRPNYLSLEKNVNVSTLFPLPTILDFCMSAIGTLKFKEGTERPTSQVASVLAKMQFLLESCIKLAVTGDDGANVDDESSIYDDAAEAIWDLSDPSNGLAELLEVPGAVDFLVRCGISRRGTCLLFKYEHSSSRVADDPAAPPPRLIIGLGILRDERRHINRSEGRVSRCQPIMARYGSVMAAFDEADKRYNDPLVFPTFEDLLEWVRLRNYFYLAIVASSGEFDLDDDLSTDGPDDTWLAYFSEARGRCQDILERVESYHSVFRLRGLSKTPATLLGDSLALQLRRKAAASSPTPRATPPRRSHAAEPLSPLSECLTRTPRHPAERALVLAARPPLTDLYRDPESEVAGLLNLRQNCFANAFVQFVFAIPAFVSAVFAFPTQEALRAFRGANASSSPLPSAEVMAHERVVHRLQAVFACMKVASKRAINTLPFLEAVAAASPRFGDGGQHDPHEFAASVFDSMGEALKSASQADASVAEALAEVQWDRFLHIQCVSSALTRRQLHNTELEVVHAPAANDKEDGWVREASFVPIYFQGSSTPAAELAARADRLRLPGLEHAAPSQTQKSGQSSTGAAATSHAEAADGDQRDEAADHVIQLDEQLEDFFTEVIDDNLESDNEEHIVTRLRWISKLRDELPASFFIVLPSRVTLDGKRFDRVGIPASLNLTGYHLDCTNPQHHKRLRLARAKCELATVERARERTKASFAAASKALHGAPDVVSNAVEALLAAYQSATQDYERRLTDCEDKVRKGRSFSATESEFSYVLSAIIVHVGRKGREGHYIAYVKHDENSWNMFNDSEVENIRNFDPNCEAVQRNAYCFAYVKEDIGRCSSITVPPPAKLRTQIEREDLRSQLEAARILSEAS